ncbi:alpha-amylase [Thelephora ganbajun]|uniref:Alpha-amylase n=1 Tax=Thelephora ganbajun TaxID=370292 RepID=A0ACB6Z6I0_THEGA|nr:alpha-amylase [Thelephora ganbajun]
MSLSVSRALALATCFAASSLAASVVEWQERSIYQVLTDRFALEGGGTARCVTDDRKYCGGTYRGIIDKLDYIQNLGFDAIWISPIVANVGGFTTYGEAYHGYWAQDIYKLNSHFGSADDLVALSNALHARDMYLMVDVVVNHFGPANSSASFESFNPFNKPSYFHPRCLITNYNNQTDVEQCWLGDDKVALADVNTENLWIVTTLNRWIASLVKDYRIDGIRIDTVKHVRKDFWPLFAAASGIYTVGEVFHSNTAYVADYTYVLDGVLDYPTWYQLFPAFQTSTGNLSALAEVILKAQRSYKTGLFGSGVFSENHDQPRFASLTTDTARIKNVIAFPFIHDGIPILYYGQEQGYTGGNDPANREALWLSGYVEEKEFVDHVKTLNAARKAAIATCAEYLVTPMEFPEVTATTLAVYKHPLLALFTNVGSHGTTSWDVQGTDYAPGTELLEVFSCSKVYVDSTGGLTALSTSGQPQLYIPASAPFEHCKNR